MEHVIACTVGVGSTGYFKEEKPHFQGQSYSLLFSDAEIDGEFYIKAR